jgi:hypothetical protein
VLIVGISPGRPIFGSARIGVRVTRPVTDARHVRARVRLYRLVCSNGLTVADADLAQVSNQTMGRALASEFANN